MDGSTTENNWDNRWDQTVDLNFSDGNFCTITGDHGTSVACTVSKAPFQVCVSGTWLAFTGETITLNAVCAGATHYQWYKGSDPIDGATSATYTKTNCTYADAGNYSCKAWDSNESNAVWSSAFGVKVPRLSIQTGGGGDRQDIAFTRTSTSAETATCEVYLGVAWTYEYVIDDGHNTYGNSGTMYSTNCTGWKMDSKNLHWCHIHTTKEGTYRFNLSFSNSTYEDLWMTVNYPPMAQRGGVKVYIENTPDMQARGWSNDKIYYRLGKGKYDDGDTRNWTAAQLMTLVPGTDRYLYTETPEWSDNFWVWHIANNAGWAASNNSIYKTKTGDSWAITESSNFHGDELTVDQTIILNSTSGGIGGDPMNDNCAFYGYTHVNGMITHNASVGATTHGQIKVEYTHHDGTDHSSEDYTARNFNGLAHTCKLTITAEPDCGYRIASLTVNGNAFTNGTVHVLDADATIAATFEIDDYTVSLDPNGGTINSGNVTSYTHGTGATLPTDVTQAGKYFDGWYDNVGLTGSPVTEITTSDCGNKAYWAKWGDCPDPYSGEILYKFVVNSSMANGNICSSGHNPQSITTPTQLSTLIGGTLDGYITNNSSWSHLIFSSGSISQVSSDRGILILTLQCPIEEGDLIRFKSSSSSSGTYNYLRHTSYSTSGGQLTLNAIKTSTEPEMQQLVAPAAFDGKTDLFIVVGNRTTKITYFEIIRPCVLTLNANGGTVNGNTTEEHRGALNEDVALPHAFKDGFRFKGWFTAPTGGSPVGDVYALTGNTTLYAQYEDCPDIGTLYKFEVGTGLTNGSVTANNTSFEFNTSNYLTTLVGGTLTTAGSSASYVKIANTNSISLENSGAYLKVDMDCALEEGDYIKSTIGGNTMYVTKTVSRTNTMVLEVGNLLQKEIPAELVGEKTLYLWKGSNNATVSYFEIVRACPVTLDAGTNGGTVGGNATKIVYGAIGGNVALPHAFKDGFRFKGWFTAPTGGSPVSDSYTITGATTLYAQFEDCPENGTLYKFESKTDWTTGNFTETGTFDMNTGNYLTTLLGGTLAGYEGNNNHYISKENGTGIKIGNNSGYLKVDLDCELEEGDVIKSTVGSSTVYVTTSTSRTSTMILEVGNLQQKEIPAALVGQKTLYLWRGSGNATVSYFEIIRPRRTTITLSAPDAFNNYTTTVVATYEQPMPAIQTMPQRSGYVFEGYFDAPDGAGTQYYNGLGYGTKNWDKDVSSCTLYASWKTPCDVAPTLTTIVPVTTIWDAKDVDMSLVHLTCDFDTTGIHYSLVSASEDIPGCTFTYFDERIFIQGTPAVGNTMVETHTITFTMSNDCSPAHTYTVNATIRIYPADRKARLAYIVTGTKDGAFNAYEADDETKSAELLTYLRQFYTVNCVNGYATKDAAALAAYYDDYDLLIVTDFLDTGEGYTNAIGTLIDKKPILSFEAYVAKQSNWHIASNPEDPSPKNGVMKVLCAGHAIFGDAEGVEVINKPGGVSDTTVTVLNTPYNGKALQGFVINEAPDFIFLATVRDADNSRDLIVCCERQVVFPARLMLYGINFNEMDNLTPAGKVVMHQMIDYLLMTDETKVADCSLVFDNHAGDNLWSNPSNWAPGYNIIPTPYHPTRIIAECHVNIDNAHAGSVKVNAGRDEHNNPVDGKLIVKPYGGLTVAGLVAKVNDTRYASPTTIKAEDLLIESDNTGNGAFVYGNKESDVRATVEYYSLGENANTANPVWQYIGIPFRANQTAIKMYYAGWMCRWAEGTTDDLGGLWKWVENEDVLLPFEGYCITQNAKKTYTFSGKLNPPVTTTLNLDNRDADGYAFAANSWTAPIKIQEMADADFINTEKAIYIYHSGTYANWTVNGTPVSAVAPGAAATLPGQYAVIPIHSSPYLSGADSVIPSMQGFFVKTTGSDPKLKLVYNKVVYDAKYFKTSTQPMRAPSRTGSPEVMRLVVSGEQYGADQAYLLARSDFSESFEDGWDGRKIEGDANAPMMAVVKEDGEMAVAAVETANEHYLSFRAGRDSLYTFQFNYDGETIYLLDLETNQVTPIATDNTYSFFATNTTAINRFLITDNPYRNNTTTDIENGEGTNGEKANGVRKILIHNQLYILRGNTVYRADGRIADGKEVMP